MFRDLTLNQTVKIMRDAGVKISPESLADRLERNIYPFGRLVSAPGTKRKFEISEKYLLDWLEETFNYTDPRH